MTRGVIFDCDGVLVDTEGAANRVLAELLTGEGLPTTAEDSMRTYMGRSWASCMALAAEQLGRDLPADLHDRYTAGVRAAWAERLDPIPGIVEALDRIDLPACVASSGEHERMRFTLGRTGLYDRFAGRIFSATEVRHGKPAPDLFLHAASRMGFAPQTTTVVEDTVPGVQAGRAAGMRVLAFARHTPAAALAAAGGEPFDDMRALPALLGLPSTRMAANEKPQVDVPEGSPSYQLELDDLAVGEGDEAVAGKVVEVHYVGVSWQTGDQFDASWDRGDTFKFKLGRGQVIPGWDQGVEGMKVGGRRRITIPPNLAYGKRGAGGVIGPDETLIFVVDLVGVS